jgi:beta-phosphoglucomutase-like phosphatase (HAD superfamily)
MSIMGPIANDTNRNLSYSFTLEVTEKKLGRDVHLILNMENKANRRVVELVEAQRIDAANVTDRTESVADPALRPVLDREARGRNLGVASVSPPETVLRKLRTLKGDRVAEEGYREQRHRHLPHLLGGK